MKNACQVLFAQYHDCQALPRHSKKEKRKSILPAGKPLSEKKKIIHFLAPENDKKEEFYGIIFHIKMLYFIPVIIRETAETRFYEIYSVIRPFQGFHDPYVFPALHRDADRG